MACSSNGCFNRRGDDGTARAGTLPKSARVDDRKYAGPKHLRIVRMITQRSSLAIHGGAPAATCSWPAWPVWDDAERTKLLNVLESGQWWYGEQVKQFERDYAAFHHVSHGVSCTNGTAAIEMALRALGVVAGDEVVVPAYTFIATASAVITVGAIPVFADIEEDTLCLDPADVERKITSRTKAIIPVHVAGRFANMTALSAIARKG